MLGPLNNLKEDSNWFINSILEHVMKNYKIWCVSFIPGDINFLAHNLCQWAFVLDWVGPLFIFIESAVFTEKVSPIPSFVLIT